VVEKKPSLMVFIISSEYGPVTSGSLVIGDKSLPLSFKTDGDKSIAAVPAPGGAGVATITTETHHGTFKMEATPGKYMLSLKAKKTPTETLPAPVTVRKKLGMPVVLGITGVLATGAFAVWRFTK
jgi:hypothetical protein